MQDLIDSANKAGAIVSTWEGIKAMLFEASLAWEQKCKPEYVATHMRNRSGEGVGAIQSHHHGHDITVQGWSWHKAADAVAVEYVGDDASLRFNTKLVEVSDECFPPFKRINLLSISASHTNAFLRSVKFNCKSACPMLADAHGRLNHDEIVMNRDGLKNAIAEGLTWCVLSDIAANTWPNLIDMVQASMNTQAREAQSEVEVMLGMMRKAQGGDVDWDAIQTSAKFSNPPCKAWVGELCKFVRNHGGGGEILNDLNMFSRTMTKLKNQKAAGSQKTLGSEFWAKLNGLAWGADRRPWVMNAAIKANLASPPNMVVDGFCKLISAKQLTGLAHRSNAKLVKECESLMTDARAVSHKLNLTEPQQALILGKLDARCIWHILKCGKAGEGRAFDTVADIAQAVHIAKHILHHHVHLSFPWRPINMPIYRYDAAASYDMTHGVGKDACIRS